ncbi:sulfotransferase domain-containing protein [Sulfurimonas diazotrophicus]|uniref:Sulfotransferase domain-containing protein n=1 Tax=Sulfurimonas diazotrophicus TaxID=3131939 RepID=A0ABZ3H928_9BACT
MRENLPNLIIGGVFKAGTTSLFSYLSAHQKIAISSKKELGYFVPLQFDQGLPPLEEYTKYFTHIETPNDFAYILEASPGYLYGGQKVARMMQKVLGEFKVIFILREPKSRLYSFYEYLKSNYVHAYASRLKQDQITFINEMTYESYCRASLDYYRSGKNNIENDYFLSGIKYGLYYRFLKEWFEVLDSKNIKIVFLENMEEYPKETMLEICEWLNIPSGFYESYEYKVQNKTQFAKWEWLHKMALTINRQLEPFFRKNLYIKDFLKKVYFSLNKKETHQETLGFETSTEVSDLFNEENLLLKNFLEKQKYSHSNFPQWLKESGQ